MPKVRFLFAFSWFLFQFVIQPGSVAYAQTTSTGAADQSGPTETLKVNVNVVQLFFNVKEKEER